MQSEPFADGERSLEGPLSAPLRQAVEAIRQEPIPTDSMCRALEAARHACVRPVSRRRIVRRMLVGAGIAAAVLLAGVLWKHQPSVAWADVVEAVAAKPWVHVATTDANGQITGEAWVSPTHEITAFRSTRYVRYDDHRLRIYHGYDPQEGVLYRVPDVGLADKPYFIQISQTLQALFDGSETEKKSLAKMVSLAFCRDVPVKLVAKNRRVPKDNPGLVEYELTAQGLDTASGPIETVIRLDAKTGVPHSWTIRGKFNGIELQRRLTFDYPEQGPADVYALGVPTSAKLVDRVPRGDVARLIDAMRAERSRFDDYFAVVVATTDGGPGDWWGYKPDVIWRKGNKWRREWPVSWPIMIPPDANADQASWFLNYVSTLTDYRVLSACDGKTMYRLNYRSQGEVYQGPTYPLGTPLVRFAAFPGESVISSPVTDQPGDTIPLIFTFMPEYRSHPPMGVPSEQYEPILETDPKEGPAGTVLLRVVQSGKPRGAKRSSFPAGFRFWIDPSHSYVAMRSEFDYRGGTDTFIVEQLERSPQGHWYPTVVREKDASTSQEGTTYDRLWHYFLDFNAEIPDELFELPGK